MAAVHEEIVKLPESLRVPFVLCSIEGKSVTEAAEQLGWKLGTLSGRLTRAKDALLARLNARGITVGAAAALICTGENAPAAVLTKAAELVRGGAGAVPALSNNIFALSEEALRAMFIKKITTGAAVLVVCSIVLGGAALFLRQQINASDAPIALAAATAPTRAARSKNAAGNYQPAGAARSGSV